MRRIGWHVTFTGDMINAYEILVGNLKRRDHLCVLGVHERIILK